VPDYGSRFPTDNAAEDSTPVKQDTVVKKPVVIPKPAPDTAKTEPDTANNPQ
jgi:hypothetical protein